ncbi:MAG: hypothetical protein M1815_004298, partial [Lichina confinis]
MKRPQLSTTGSNWRRASTLQYHTFPVQPPTSRGRPPLVHSTTAEARVGGSAGQADDGQDGSNNGSPLPTRQLIVLAIISLAEQTALNSVSPYLPDMASTFPSVDPSRVGLDVGTIASAFALAQFVTGFFWGWLSDRVGRKPVIIFGTLLTAGCFMAFGFCKTLWQAILVQALMGLTNGNQAVVPTCLGEITDRSNQSRAFMWLPVVYGVGAISGPIIGGLLVAARNPDGTPSVRYPYLLPNLISAAILLVDALVTIFYLDETLEHVRNLPPLSQRLGILFTWCWRTCSVKASRILHVDLPGSHRHHHHHNRRRPSFVADSDEADVEDVMSNASTQDSLAAMPALFPHQRAEIDSKDVLNKDTVLLMVSYLIFQLCNVAYMSLYPIFASSLPPTGRGLSPGVIGISLAFAGVVTILFQLGVFGRFRDALGNRGTYRVAFAGFTIAFFAMPFVGYKDTYHGTTLMWQKGTMLLWVELGIILLIKTIATIGGLTSVLLMITNSAPNHNVLGTLNGLAQTLAAAGRATAPFV